MELFEQCIFDFMILYKRICEDVRTNKGELCSPEMNSEE